MSFEQMKPMSEKSYFLNHSFTHAVSNTNRFANVLSPFIITSNKFILSVRNSTGTLIPDLKYHSYSASVYAASTISPKAISLAPVTDRIRSIKHISQSDKFITCNRSCHVYFFVRLEYSGRGLTIMVTYENHVGKLGGEVSVAGK